MLAASLLAVGGPASSTQAEWRPLVTVPRVVDVVGPRADGRLVLATQAGLFLLRPGHAPQPFARGPGGYVGGTRLVAESGLPAGGDIGVEGIGFVPHGLGPDGAAYFADLGGQAGSPTHGTDSVLVLRGKDLSRARLRAGELVAATESGARTIAIRCSSRCTVRRVAVGPAATHGEGHVTFVPER